MCGDDLILCRFNGDCALRRLVAKFEKAKGAMRRRLQEKRRVRVARRKMRAKPGRGPLVRHLLVMKEERGWD